MKLKILAVLAVAALLTSCFKKEDFNLDMIADNQDVSYDLALPLFETKFTIDDILHQLNNSQLVTDNDGLVHFVFPSMLSVNYWKRLELELPKSISTNINGIPYWKHDTVVTYTYSDTVTFFVRNNGGNIPVDSVFISELNLSCDVVSEIGCSIAVHLAFPSLIDVSTRKPVMQDMEISARRAARNQTINLTNVMWNSAHDRNEQNVYRVPVQATIIADFSTATNTSPSTGSLNTAISFVSYNYNRIYGYIGSETYTLRSSVNSEKLTDIPVDNVTLYQLFLTSRISLNGISIPARLKSNRAAGIKTNGDTLELPPLFSENYDIPSPLPTDNPLQKTTEHKSEIRAAVPLEEMGQFFGEFVFETNPSDLNYQQNILESGANVAIDFDLDVPMDLSLVNYNLSDTVPFDMFTSDMIDMIHEFNLKMILKNAFPIDADVSVRFLDSAYNTALIIYEGKISGGEVGQDLHVVKPEIINVPIDLLADETLALRKIRYISVVSKLDTKNSSEVKIFAGNEGEGYLSVKAGVRVKLKAGTLVKDFLK
ncbi:MAG: hypothetical protein LBG17_01955 [Bacteroidales bacterium]|jgi:hypothetical protein|nr:hypothetical protein [Bacteroidales bacterium]